MIQAGEIYDVGNDVNREFSEEFKKYVHEESLVCRRNKGRIYSISVFTKDHEPGGFISDVSFNHFLSDTALKFETGHINNIPTCLVQFWRAEEVSNIVDGFVERSFQLTTRNQPFLLGDQSCGESFIEEICSYRMKTHDIIITGDGRVGGPISRAFKNMRMEITPDVAYYSYEEFPQRDLALSCDISYSLIVPLSDSYGRTVGVMEAVSPYFLLPEFIQYLLSYSKENNGCKDLCGQYDLEKDLLHSEMYEIEEVMEGVCESCDIHFAQTWILCKRCNSSFNSEICDQKLSVSYWGCYEDEIPFFESEFCILQKGEGIVGKAAASSHNLVYCKDIAKFSIAEYPMAHFARLHNLSACFAICLGSKHSEDRAHVLEFFLDSSSVKGRDLRAILFPKLNVMRHKFRTFKMASGGELRDSLSIQVIDANFPDKFETLEIGILDLTSTTDDNNVEAFKFFGEFSRPYILQQSIGENETNETYDDSMLGLETSLHDMSIEGTTVYSASTVESEFHVTLKAVYGENCFIWIQLKASSGIDDLKQQVSQKLNLAVGTYDLKYRDEDSDLIELACDDDLKYYITSSTMLENCTLMVFIVPK